MSELNTNMSDEDRKQTIVTKPIGNFYYTIINKGYNDYVIIGKAEIANIAVDIWEDME